MVKPRSVFNAEGAKSAEEVQWRVAGGFFLTTKNAESAERGRAEDFSVVKNTNDEKPTESNLVSIFL